MPEDRAGQDEISHIDGVGIWVRSRYNQLGRTSLCNVSGGDEQVGAYNTCPGTASPVPLATSPAHVDGGIS